MLDTFFEKPHLNHLYDLLWFVSPARSQMVQKVGVSGAPLEHGDLSKLPGQSVKKCKNMLTLM